MTGPRTRWGLSVQDWRSHAIDICRDHPQWRVPGPVRSPAAGVVPLQERPLTAPCPTCATLQLECATLQLELVQAALDRAAAALGKARSGHATRRQQDE